MFYFLFVVLCITVFIVVRKVSQQEPVCWDMIQEYEGVIPHEHLLLEQEWDKVPHDSRDFYWGTRRDVSESYKNLSGYNPRSKRPKKQTLADKRRGCSRVEEHIDFDALLLEITR